MTLICDSCGKIFNTKSGVNKHYKSVHKAHPESSTSKGNVYNYKCLESQCNNAFRQCSDLVEHLKKQHNFNVETEETQFKRIEDFNCWRHETEVIEKCNYVSARGKRVLASGLKKIYYVCNRSGKFRTNIKESVKRCPKSQGSAKLNRACISQMTVLIDKKNRIHVTRIKTHYGHTKQLQHLRLNPLDKKEIASQLINGASEVKILDAVRNEIRGDIKRIDLLTRQDLANVKRSFNLETLNHVKHINDAFTVDSWVTECRSERSEYNPIIFYKQQGQAMPDFEDSDFCLIIMNEVQASLLKQFGMNIVVDSNSGLNNYNFEMTTVMVVDEFNEGFPVTFMFSSKKNALVYEILFQCVKEKVGHIKCEMFMSDLTSVVYNAWVQTMGQVSHHSYCPWHVDRAWQADLLKISNTEKRRSVYKMIKSLQKSVDLATFQDKIAEALLNMINDDETRDFGVYFTHRYANKCEKWAYCYRQSCVINSNVRLESMHKVIRYFQIDGKSVKQLDTGLRATLRYVRDKIVDRINKQTKGKQNVHRKKINQMHTWAITSSFQVARESTQTWKVSTTEDEYFVEKCSGSEKCCKVVCEHCDICIHDYTCSCSDFLITTIICKHIHFVVHMNNIKYAASHSQLQEISNDEEAVEDCVSFLCESSTTDIKADNTKNKMLAKLSDLQTHVHLTDTSQVSDGILRQFLLLLNDAKALIDLPKARNKNQIIEHTNSTESGISQIFLIEKEEYISNDANTDHGYL